MKLTNLKLGVRLTGGFLVIAGLALALGVVGQVELRDIADRDQLLYRSFMAPMRDVIIMAERTQRQRVALRDALLATEPAAIEAALTRFTSHDSTVAAALETFRAGVMYDDERAATADWEKSHAALRAAQDGIIAELRAGRRDAALQQLGKMGQTASDELQKATERLTEVELAHGKAMAEENAATAAGGTRFMLILNILGTLGAIALGLILARSVSRPLKAMAAAARRIALGDTGQAIEHRSGDEVGELAESFRGSIEYLRGLESAMDRLGHGDLSARVTVRSEADSLSRSVERALSALRKMTGEATALTGAARAGQLDTRADLQGLEGAYGEVVGGVNATLDAVTGPVRVAADYVARLAKGEIPPRLTQHYAGEFERLRDNLNQCLDSMTRLIGDTDGLVRAAFEGRLETRAALEQHQGDFRRIVEGVNRTLDAVLEPIDAAADILQRVAGGDLTALVGGQYRGEHANIQQSINKTVGDLRLSIQSISGSAASLSRASEELSAVSASMGGSAEETSAQANVVSAASEQVSRNVQTVATGTEEMSASIREIAKNAMESARVAGEAVRAAEATNATVSALGQSSAQIGEVVKVITSIAQQTNLLALNATIEAARAGEAGKGFAVVANEVKELAKETARATEEIGQRIQAIQSDSLGAVEAIAGIGAVIARISDISTSIASAVEEQTATTNEISRNVSEAARGAAEITRSIHEVAQAASATAAGSEQTRQSAGALAEMACELQGLVGRFHV